MQRGANTSVLWISAAGGLLAICSLPLRWHQEILGPAGPVLDVRGWNVQPFASLLVAALLTTAVVVYRRVRSGSELQRPLLAALLAPLLTLLWMLLSDAVPDAQDRFSRPIGGGYFFLAASAVAQAAALWLLLRQAEPRAESAPGAQHE